MQRQHTSQCWLALGALALVAGCGDPQPIIIYVPVPADIPETSQSDTVQADLPDGSETFDGTAQDAEVSTDVGAETDSGVDFGPGPVCTPDGWYCVNDQQSAKCNASGTGNAEFWDCKQGEVCSIFDGRCSEVVCSPGARKCASDGAFTICRPDGTGYLPPTTCAPEQICFGEGTCVLESCIGNVLFLVDTSGSMALHWDAVKGSINTLKGNNPFSRFGLWTFPQGASACNTNPTPAVALADATMPAILSWFDIHEPYGQTPLVDAYQAVVNNAGSIFGSEGGAVVILSDGADTCKYSNILDPVENSALKVADLTAAATGLYSNHDIKTYVIGYQYAGDAAQLDALATNGGTDATGYTEAGSESELASALVDVLEDLKLCLTPQ